MQAEEAKDMYIKVLEKKASYPLMVGSISIMKDFLEVGGEDAQFFLRKLYKRLLHGFGSPDSYLTNTNINLSNIEGVLRELENPSADTIQFLYEISEAEFREVKISVFF